MTALDPFTAASLTYSDAIRSLRPHKTGEAIQVMPGRSTLKAIALAILPSLLGAAFLMLIAGVVVSVVERVGS